MDGSLKILALDLATHTGWAQGETHSDAFDLGTWELATRGQVTQMGKTHKDRSGDIRIGRLWDRLAELRVQPDVIVWEDVEFSSSRKQTQLWASLRTVVWLYCGSRKIIGDCCGVTTLKKFGSGFSSATKPEMMRSAALRFPTQLSWTNTNPNCVTRLSTGERLDDNAIDALHLLMWARQTFRHYKKP